MNCPRNKITGARLREVEALLDVYGVARVLEAVRDVYARRDNGKGEARRVWTHIVNAAAESALLVYSLPHSDE